MVAANVLEPGSGLHAGKEITPAIAGFHRTPPRPAGSWNSCSRSFRRLSFPAIQRTARFFQILIISVMFGTAALLVGDKARQVISIVE